MQFLYILFFTSFGFIYTTSLPQISSGEVRCCTDCITFIIEEDNVLGELRNKAPLDIPLHKAIKQYAEALYNLDYTECPEEFTKAFLAHVADWESLIPIAKKYPDKRGEMHDVFDELRETEDGEAFEQRINEIRASWKIVEKFVENP